MQSNGNTAEFSEKIASELDCGRMMEDITAFSRLYRYSGSEDGEKAVDILMDRLGGLGIDAERERYPLYRSLPGTAFVKAEISGEEQKVPLTPYVYSGSADELYAPLVFDLQSESGCTQREMEKRCQAFAGKIVLTYDSSFSFACRAKQAGALGILTIWNADLAHHGTLGGVWGTPEPEDLIYRYPYLPYAEIVKTDGEKLKKLCLQSEKEPTVCLHVEMDNRIVQSSMAVAKIKGQRENFVLVSGHYDSWYEGVTDNGVANAAMLELARVLKAHGGELRRTLVLAWWSGHSDGRYSGSTWYYDHNWQELHDRCVAHINMDICGCQGSNLVGFNTSMLEGLEFNDRFLREFNDEMPPEPVPMARFADQTFFGANVPFAIMPKFTKKVKDGQAAFYWWHTVEDTLDKVDPVIVLRDAKVVAKLACVFADCPRLPAKMGEFGEVMEKRLRLIRQGLHEDFRMEAVFTSLAELRGKLETLEKTLEAEAKEEPTAADTDGVIMAVCGELTRLAYTASSPYHQDPAVDHGMFPALSEARGLTPENTDEACYLAARTRFLRQANRLTGQMKLVGEMIDRRLADGAGTSRR